MNNIKYLLGYIFLCIPLTQLLAQPTMTANDTVPPYGTTFRLSVNPGHYGPYWTDEEKAELSAGVDSLGVAGVGIKSFRVPLPEIVIEDPNIGYDFRVDAFDYYDSLGVHENVVFLESPSADHIDSVQYCPGVYSTMFKNMYSPIWDNGENNTPVNDTNYAALYIYKTVELYKDNVKFWEVWNEPDLDYSGNGWRPEGDPLSWFDSLPQPCDTKLQAPIYHYVRLLRITYDIVKTFDPDAYVTVGGLGYEGYLDALLRVTDNPVDGSVTMEYPFYAGAYFDVMSYHAYPHFNGSLRYWDNSCSCFIYTRNSDAAADGFFNAQQKFVTVLNDYGYDGTTYPEKLLICTETNIPSKQFEEYPGAGQYYIGSFEAQRNYGMKIIIRSFSENLRYLAMYQLADRLPVEQQVQWYQACGLYKDISADSTYSSVVYTEQGIGVKTLMDAIEGTTYDSTETALMNVPVDVKGYAFKKPDGEHVYALWAIVQGDHSEVASAMYSFPDTLGLDSLQRRNWDFFSTQMDSIVGDSNIVLTGDPSFFQTAIPPCPVVNYYPDLDGDGFGNLDSLGVPVCTSEGDTIPTGYVANNFDCDDTDPTDVTLEVNGSPIVSGFYQANDTVSSYGLASLDSTILFEAGNTILLSPGFVAEAGSNFQAKLGVCMPINTFSIPEKEEDEEVEKIQNLPKEKNIVEEKSLKQKTQLSLFPNPAKNETVVSYFLNKNSTIRILVFDLTGNLVTTLLDQQYFSAGQHQLSLHTARLATGTYSIFFQTDDEVITKKLVIIN